MSKLNQAIADILNIQEEKSEALTIEEELTKQAEFNYSKFKSALNSIGIKDELIVEPVIGPTAETSVIIAHELSGTDVQLEFKIQNQAPNLVFVFELFPSKTQQKSIALFDDDLDKTLLKLTSKFFARAIAAKQRSGEVDEVKVSDEVVTPSVVTEVQVNTVTPVETTEQAIPPVDTAAETIPPAEAETEQLTPPSETDAASGAKSKPAKK